MLGDFGDYELLEEIGRGGQGVVYRAHQKSLNRTVALKVIGLGPWATEAHLKRFRREAEAAASLDHPFIVPIHEVGERDGCCYFSMNFVEGGQLDEVVKGAPMSIRQAAELIAKVARTVHYAHEHGILHRDIKPGNILLDTKGEPHLTDFGLARLVEAESTVTRTLEAMGTPSYMAPEQAAGNNAAVGKATDVYGLGAVFYELLTGHPPFAGGTTYQTMRLLLDTEPRQPRLWNRKIARDLSTICLKCLEKDPQRRYSSALALTEDLEHWLKREPIHAKRSGFFTHARKWMRRKPAIAALIAALIALATAIAWNVWESELFRVAPEKSIAVLPFENLSKEAENAFFAVGVQDEILTNLAQVTNLKVISRTSAIQYKSGAPRNLREIGHQLGVANVVEGTVQRAGNRVRVNAQLVDARTDRHLWAETYDRDLADIFAIQSEIAEQIVYQLKSKLSSQEKAAIEQKPTADLAAYDLYIRAKILTESALFSTPLAEGLFEAVRLLDQAIQLDPGFARAYVQIAHAHDLIYFTGLDHTPARVAMADAAIQSLARLRRNSAEVHRALGEHLYRCFYDYDHARHELILAKESLPNDPLLLQLLGFMDRRQGRWAESTKNLERVSELDPRNSYILQQIAYSHLLLRRYADAQPFLARAVALAPQDSNMRAFRAEIELYWHADPRPVSSTIRSIIAEDSREAGNVNQLWLEVSLCKRDFDGASQALAVMPVAGCHEDSIPFPPAWCEGIVAQMKGNKAAACSAFTRARKEAAKLVAEQTDYPQGLCVLGTVDAVLGNKEDAIREGRRAVELLPPTKDAIVGAQLVQYLAFIYAWTGEKELALEQLAFAARIPGYLSYGELQLHPRWDPLRGDPRFDKVVASLAPK
jgi:serine/threonine-protein kinase